ncbi:hypothetical protein [Bradyrhizobium sp. 62]|uniref:hypothetical protein n=1 Tax=Bradyrhizobium sp. 62 TaxID=1043588 RepID=UPI001FFBA283|nr:hypothetical protein [Bradyrhizobium sp. 62]MCK1368256.1 hypothetical protein [Bradyrhizobium sp. 62]
MTDRTADRSAYPQERRKSFDLAFPLSFATVALLGTAAWLGTIGWIAWEPVIFVLACIFD